MRSARSRASTCSIVSSRAWSWRSLYSTTSADVATPVGYACRLLGTGAVLFAARCALPAMVGGTLALVGRLAVGSSLFLIAGATLIIVGLGRRRGSQRATIVPANTSRRTDARAR